MELTVLVDNNTFIDEYYYGEPALSFYLDLGHKKYLFDTAYSDIFIKNCEKMQIDLKEIDAIILSHGHNDHTGGLRFIKESLTLIGHPDVFKKKTLNGLEIGSFLKEEEIKKRFDFKAYKGVYYLDDRLVYLGEIPSYFDFEERKPIGLMEEENDYIYDDTALVYKSDRGLFIITACSHSGICNTVKYAKEVLNEERVIGIIGGFHLFDVDERLKKTIAFLKHENIQYFYPCHCVSLKAKIEMSRALDIQEVGVGLKIDLDGGLYGNKY